MTGLYWPGSYLSPPLNSGVIMPVFQHEGKVAVRMATFTTCLMGAARQLTNFLITFVHMPSVPWEPVFFSLLIIFAISPVTEAVPAAEIDPHQGRASRIETPELVIDAAKAHLTVNQLRKTITGCATTTLPALNATSARR